MLAQTPATQASYMESVFTATQEAITDRVLVATLKERRTHWHNWTTWLSLNQPGIVPTIFEELVTIIEDTKLFCQSTWGRKC